MPEQHSTQGHRTARWTIRSILLGLLALATAYFAAIAAFFTVRIAPPAAALQSQTEYILTQFDELALRAMKLDEFVSGFKALNAGEIATLDTGAMRKLARDLARDSVTHPAAGLSPSITQALTAARTRETQVARSLLTLLGELKTDPSAVGPSIAVADSLCELLQEDLARMHRAGLIDQIVKAGEIGGAARAASTSVIAWLAVGGLLSIVMLLVFQRKVYRPLAELDAGLSEIARGRLDVTIPVHGASEIDLLLKRFNKTTALLRERSEANRRETESLLHRLGRIMENSTNEIYIVDTQTLRLLQLNRGALANLGYTSDEARELTLFDIAPKVTRQQVNELITALRAGPRDNLTITGLHKRKDGTEYPVEILLQMSDAEDPPVLVAIVQDIAERVQLTTQMRAAERMEAVGNLAAGVAHDFNNLLTVITGYSGLSLRQLDANDPLAESMEAIQSAAARASELTRHLLAFSRRQVLKNELLQLNTVIQEAERVLRGVVGENVAIQLKLSPDLGLIETDRGQLERVIVNLVVNARDAMPTGGTITITTENANLDEWEVEALPGSRPGDYVKVSVADTGIGMDEEIRSKIFEPFFTTKEQGKGTGLGLSAVYGIVKQSDGCIYVDSKPGEGTRFDIYFPMVTTASDVAAGEDPVEDNFQGNETLLVVEDEPAVRVLMKSILERAGYSVIAAEDGQQALTIAASRRRNIDLLVTDVVMPGLSGPDLAQKIRRGRPGVKTLFVSGYAHEVIAQHGDLDDQSALLEKPFTPEQLVQRVRDLIEPVTAHA